MLGVQFVLIGLPDASAIILLPCSSCQPDVLVNFGEATCWVFARMGGANGVSSTMYCHVRRTKYTETV